MLGRRIAAVPQVAAAVAPAVVLLPVVDRGEPGEEALHPERKPLVSGVHAGEEGVAAAGRHLDDPQHARHRRLEVAGDVGVPQAAGHELHLVVAADDEDLRVLGRLRRGRVDVELAEAAAQGLVLLQGQLLIAEEEDQVP